MSEKFPIAEYISLLYLGVLVLVISAFWFCFSFFVSTCRGRKTSLAFIWKYRAYGIGVLSGPNLSFIPMKFCIAVVCLFRNACLFVFSARFLGRICGWVLSAFWGLSGYIPVVFDIFLKFFSSFSECVLVVLKVCFIAYCLVVSAGFLIFAKISRWKFFWKIFGGKEKSIYLCNRKRETSAPHDEASGSLGSEWRKSSLKDLHRQINVVQELTIFC